MAGPPVRGPSRASTVQQTRQVQRADRLNASSQGGHGGPDAKAAPRQIRPLASQVVTFQPGTMGLAQKDGKVTVVEEGSQAQEQGIKVGWKITAVGDQKCTSFKDKVFQDAKNGDFPYKVTFSTSTHEVSTATTIKSGASGDSSRLSSTARQLPTTYGGYVENGVADQSEMSFTSVATAPPHASSPSKRAPIVEPPKASFTSFEQISDTRSTTVEGDSQSRQISDITGPLDVAPPDANGEVIVINEFAWDVYEAAARLSERIKAAAGLALFRDGIMFSEYTPPPEEEEIILGSGPIPRLQWGTDDAPDPFVEPSASSRTSPARSPITPPRGEVLRDVAPTPQSSRTAEEGRIDTATLLPPRVAAEDVTAPLPTDLLVGPSEMEETWVLLDGLRVRVEMLPGGLVPERDSIYEELNFLLSGLQTWEPGLEHSMPSFLQLSEMVRFSERTRSLESIYLGWAQDPNAAPHDEASKQRVCDWLGEGGEKDVAVEYLRNAGAHRCMGPDTCSGTGCGKWLRSELYKGAVQHCPQCKRPSKCSIANTANRELASAAVAGQYAAPGPVVSITGDIMMPPRRRISFEDRFISVVEVESRELAFALFLPENNSYYPALVLPSDLEFCREVGDPVVVTWLDGDPNHRQVPSTEVILLREPFAANVREATVAHWDNRVSMLLPGGDAQGEFFFGESPDYKMPVANGH